MRKVRAGTARERVNARKGLRDDLDVIRTRLKLLKGRDKLLMEMHLNNGNTFRQLAALAGVPERRISRRINQIRRRLVSGDYVICVRNRERLTNKDMAIATEYFLYGLSIRKIADRRRVGYHEIRHKVRKIKAIIQIAKATEF